MRARKTAWPRARKSKSKGESQSGVQEESSKLKSKGAAKTKNGNGLPKPSSKPYGQDGKALDGVRILDFTHVQSGPTCTQLLAWLGADVIKVERPGVGDITRGQLVDVKGADSLYFTMLNHNKRSITIDSKHPQGKRVLDELIKKCDVLVENFAPGALDRMGLTWEHIHKLNPRMIVASVKGFGPGPTRTARSTRTSRNAPAARLRPPASATARRSSPARRSATSGTGLHLALGIVSALYQRKRTGRGQKVLAAMQDGVLNLCRVKLRDQQRLKAGPLTRIQPVRRGHSVRRRDAARRQRLPAAASRAGSSSARAGRPIPNAYIYFITQAPVWERDLRFDRRADLEDRSGIRHAEGAAAEAQGDLRAHRAVDHDQDQVRGHGNLQRGRHPGRADPVDEGNRRGRVAAQDRHGGRGRSSDARQVSHRRQSDQIVGFDLRGEALAAAWASTPTRS